ncbi:thiol peroxidase [Helicobacter fennelliae]|uniref:Thiol peroxidase n=1 Tax=Helicobacter fennelliae TaxID=215 RepID=A0A2X3B680_9HELI|nr:thiol peroxidase [Helicobacter fennelliae]SQB99302.1 thiol peroxidase [Helicobacter fennelliae]
MNVKFKGQNATLKGSPLKIGDNTPEVKLVGKDLSEVTIGGAQGKTQIINIVPSLDTGVCATQARTFNQKAAGLKDCIVYVVSMDLPFAMGRFCSTEGIENLVVASDFVNKALGEKYGVLLVDSPLKGLLSRAVLVINPQGKLIYQEICEEITNEPDYEAAIKSIQ